MEAASNLDKETINEAAPPELQPNEENFPHLRSPGPGQPSSPPHTPAKQQPTTPQTLIWRMKPQAVIGAVDKGKEKVHAGSESAPLTRQGYRSGRLADDFWEALDIPDTPNTQRRKLRVLPLLTKNQTHTEFLVDTITQPYTPIATVHIAEVLAGIPWSTQRARQHVVNEVAKGLLKVLIFNNQHNTPFQKWSQGRWQAGWSLSPDGEHMCTLYVTIATPESKIRIRKGKALKWSPIPERIKEILNSEHKESIQTVGEHSSTWLEMTGQLPKQIKTADAKSFSALLDAEALPSGSPTTA